MIDIKTTHNFVEVALSGKISADDIQQLSTQVRQLTHTDTPRILIDLSDATDETSDARIAVAKLLQLKYYKVALFGATEDVENVVRYSIKAGGKPVNAQYFKHRKEAVAWLRSYQKSRSVRSLNLLYITVSAVLLAGTIWLSLYTSSDLRHRKTDAREASAQQIVKKVNDRLDNYIDQQYGFVGLFNASDHVSSVEFNQYFESIRLTQRYPGFRAISFISYVPNAQLNQYFQEYKQDPLYIQKHVVLATKPSSFGYTLPVTYAEPLPTVAANYGTDLGLSPERRMTLMSALSSGKPTFSGVFDLNNLTSKSAVRKGFFVTLPVKKDTTKAAYGSDNTLGFINAVFDYQEFFTTTLSTEKTDDIGITVTGNGQTVFTNGVHDNDSAGTVTKKLKNGNDIRFSYPSNFGLAKGQESGPLWVFIIFVFIWLLLNALFLANSRKRKSATRLAQKITEDLETQKKYAVQEEEKTKSILLGIGDGVFAIDTQQKVILFNPAAEQLSGFKSADVIGKVYRDVLHFAHEDSGKVNDTFITESLAGKHTKMSNHTVLKQKNGTLLPVADSAAPIHSAEGEVVGAIVVFRDASEERELDRQARVISEAQAKDEALIGAISDALIVFDKNGVVTRVNQRTVSLLEYSESELIGTKFSDLVRAYNFDGSEIPTEARLLTRSMKQDKAIDETFEYATKSGKRIPARVSVAPIHVDGKLVGSLELFQDITAERELDQSKDDFIGLVSHQLSTPATAVKANLGLITEGFVTEKAEIEEAVQNAYASNERQIQIVQDFLDVARLENNKLSPAHEKADIKTLIEQVAKDQAVNMSERQHELSLDGVKSIEFATDPSLLSFVLNNFVSNAGKYSPTGTPIEVSTEEDGESVTIRVKDHGVGISQADQEKLFARFSRIPNEFSTQVGGSGLGLYIVKKMVELLGGSISVESELGKGSTFIVKLPKGV